MLRSFHLAWFVAYLAVMASLWVGLTSFRDWAIETYGTPQAHQDWENWSDQVDRQAGGEGPVARRRLKSPAPPALALMTEHFTSICVVTLVLSSALFFTLSLLIRGVLTSPTTVILDDKPAAKARR